jgi:hypothetical protein
MILFDQMRKENDFPLSDCAWLQPSLSLIRDRFTIPPFEIPYWTRQKDENNSLPASYVLPCLLCAPGTIAGFDSPEPEANTL